MRHTLLRRLAYWFRRRQADADLLEELEAHRSMTQARLEQSGMAAEDARYASRRAMGNTTLAIENAREVWIWPSLERLFQDLRFAVRLLRRQPTFAATTILTLAIGIGATTTVFSVVEFEMWKPLPFPNAHRLVALYTTGPGPRNQHDNVSAPELADWRAQTHSFDGIAAYGSRGRRVLRGWKVPESLTVMSVSANFFDVLQQSPAIGRTFAPDDDRRPGTSAILSDACWRRVFNADPQVVGRSVTIEERTFAIVGVAPPTPLEFTPAPDIYVTADLAATDRNDRSLAAMARLKDGVDLSGALADLQIVAQRLAKNLPDEYKERGVRLEDLRESSTGFNWRPLFFFLGAAIFVLVLTCVNVASLLLARALRRDREFAIRRALGGGHAALARQLAVEGSLLTFPAAGLGLLFAAWAVGLLPQWLPPSYLSRGTQIELDLRVYLFALAVAGLTAILFGLAPAVLTSRRDLNPLIGGGARTVTASRTQRRARHTLVVVEVMLALILVVGAGLFLSSFMRLTQMPLGFDPNDRLTMSIPIGGALYREPRDVARFAARLVERTGAVPGVAEAVVGNSVPLGSGAAVGFAVGGQPMPAAGSQPDAIGRAVTPGYFKALGIRMAAGREFTAQDVDGAPRVAIVNENLVRHVFAGENPIGRELVLLPNRRTRWVNGGSVQIVGVIANIKDVGLNEIDFNDIFLPFDQHPHAAIQLVVRTTVPTGGMIEPLRQAVLDIDPALPVYGVRSMQRMVEGAFQGSRFNLLLISTFAVLAIVMAAIGIYGAMSYSVEQRTKEFGVRLALGAPRFDVLRLALGQATCLGVIGTGLGLGASLLLARILGSALYLVPRQHDGVLYGVSTTDPLTLMSAGVAVLIIASMAGLVPARRAMRVDPVVALRAE